MLSEQPPLSEQMVDGGRAAALHLLELGCVPLLRRDTLTALHERGGADRALVEQLWELAG